MPDDFLSTSAWVLWLALILIFVIIEVMSLEFTFLMLAVGSLGGLVSGVFGAHWLAQIVIAAILSMLLLFLVRPQLLRHLKKGSDPTPSNVEALLGLGGTVIRVFDNGAGQVKLANGETWTSRLSPGSPGSLDEGERVVVTAIDGATAVVVPAERTAL